MKDRAQEPRPNSPAATRVALLFPGQGSEEPGMGLALARSDPDAAALLEEASRATGERIERLLERGGRALSRTEILQPALAAVGLGAARALMRRGLRPAWVAGHSLGELSAACFSAGLSPRAAMELAASRGAAMGSAAAAEVGAMAAVKASLQEVEAALREAPTRIGLAAHNARDEVVISGPAEELSALLLRARLPARRLRVAGAWHSEGMLPAVEPTRARLAAAFEGRALGIPLLTAAEGRVGAVAPEDVAGTLAEGIVRPLRFVELLLRLEEAGARELIVLAPSRILRSLARRTLGARLAIHGADGPADLEAIAARLGRR